MAKKLNYTAARDFEYAGVEYKKGETFRKPDDWTLDEDYAAVLRMSRPGVTLCVFSAPFANGFEVVHDEQGRKKQEPVIDYRRVIIPVE
jgi:hypothetical protein